MSSSAVQEEWNVTSSMMTPTSTASALISATTTRTGQTTVCTTELVGWSRGEISTDIYRGYAHGEALFRSFDGAERVSARVLDWLNAHLGSP